MPNKADEKKQAESSEYMPVQDYTGQGYSFDNGEETGKFANQHRKQIVEKVKQYFNKKYHLDITVHQIYGATDAAVVFVESKKDPKFHTSVIVGIDLENKKIGDVGAYEGSVEGAITTGLYVMAYEKEFQKLDAFCTAIAREYPVIGRTKEAVDHTASTGFTTPYYYTSTSDLIFPEAYHAFLHKESYQNIIHLIKQKPFDKEGMMITLTFFMEKKHSLPDKSIAKGVIDKLKKSNGLPPGNYGVYIKSNEILKRTGTAKKQEGTTSGIDDIILEPSK
ncbi:MAG: DUF1672 family protein [Heyndrickxia faecalis]|nr:MULTISPECIES: DUF1672 family protein [Heyndrickxia]KYC63419.1 hypothetical protein B4100_3461 [Heyndrickxia coagulans]MCI1576055.1 DUF1672 domain-containing protein [Heyndrickxia coagulans]MED4320699.1 DUF1672 family protein [Weizmannia sp. CD-2023]UXC24035.1 DUF1672 domain-containing protein [Heyndrickxia coagulans]